MLLLLRRTADGIWSGHVETPDTGSSVRSEGMGQVTLMFFHCFLTLGAVCSLGSLNQKIFLGSVSLYARIAFSLMTSLTEMYALSRVFHYLTSPSISKQVNSTRF